MYRTEQDAAPVELGPSSLLWRYAGDTRIAFLGSSIGLLQLMHPAIGAGVLDHSAFFDDPTGRVFRSLPRILGAVYDEDPVATGREVRGFHNTIKGELADGSSYHALDPATFWWAHATFQYMAEQVVDRWDRHSLSADEREQLYREGVEWYRRYGVSDRVVPPTRAAFQVEWDRVCAEDLEMNDAVRFVLKILDAPRLPAFNDHGTIPGPIKWLVNQRAVRRTVAYPLRVIAIGGLPPIVRERFDIAWTRRNQREFNLMRTLVGNTWNLLPAGVRWQPAAAEGWRRETGRLP
jgi:uncharacterized protein (DUF2236 family)